MPHASGRSASLLSLAALCALCACGAVQHPQPRPLPDDEPIAAGLCTLDEPPLREGDSAVVHFGAGDTPRACALELIARELRPWASTPNDRWAVRITLTERGARVHRLDHERARDAIDSGEALIATEDVELVAYAASRSELEVTPLSWDRIYVLLTPGPAAPLGVASLPDAVRADARPAEVDPACAVSWPAAVPDSVTPRSLRVVYEAGDRTAQELAERIVAIVGGTTVASPLDAAALDTALRAGDELGYVVSLPRFAPFACDSLATLAQRAPWLGPHRILPLIDTRAHAIAPRTPRP